MNRTEPGAAALTQAELTVELVSAIPRSELLPLLLGARAAYADEVKVSSRSLLNPSALTASRDRRVALSELMEALEARLAEPPPPAGYVRGFRVRS